MRGVVVMGPSRSGTSMVSGLFAAHGVFFGETFGPHDANPKGNLENKWLKEVRRGDLPADWPGAWFKQLRAEGWTEDVPWGVKIGPSEWPMMEPTDPTVVVQCFRPPEQIIASRERAPGWKACGEEYVRSVHETMREMKPGCEVVEVSTPSVARGDYSDLLFAFYALDMELDRETADSWVDEGLFHG